MGVHSGRCECFFTIFYSIDKNAYKKHPPSELSECLWMLEGLTVPSYLSTDT